MHQSKYYYPSDSDVDILNGIICEDKFWAYQLQDIEIDANAYAYMYLKSQGLSDNDIMETGRKFMHDH